MRTTNRLIVGALLMAFGFSGCYATVPEDGQGSASVTATVAGLSADDVVAIQITVSGPNISPDIVSDLTKDPGTGDWSGTIENIPAGTNRTFLAEASNASAEVVYSGSATGVTITDGQQVVVNLFLQQTTPPDPFTNTVPIFESLVVSSAQVAPGNDVTLTVTVSDPDPGDVLTLLWTATGGSFDVTDAPSVVWSAPSTEGLYELTVAATDNTGATSTLTVSIDVQLFYGSGSASVQTDINTWPEIQNLVPSPTRIDVSETTQLSLTAVDPDGDPLTYAWSADCTGTFSEAAIEDPTFTLDADHGSAPCALTVTIDDGRGGSNSASVNIATGPSISGGPPGVVVVLWNGVLILNGDTTPSQDEGTDFGTCGSGIPGTDICPVEREFEIRNQGGSDLFVSAITATEASFTPLGPCVSGCSVPPSSSGFFSVIFEPTDLGPTLGEIVIVNDASTYSFAVAGDSIAPP